MVIQYDSVFQKISSDDFGSVCIHYWCGIEPLLESFLILIERNEIDIEAGLRYFLKKNSMISHLHESGLCQQTTRED